MSAPGEIVAAEIRAALFALEHLTTAQFGEGGDRPARLALVAALAEMGYPVCMQCPWAGPRGAARCEMCGRAVGDGSPVRHASPQAWRRLRSTMTDGELAAIAVDIAELAEATRTLRDLPQAIAHALISEPWDERRQA